MSNTQLDLKTDCKDVMMSEELIMMSEELITDSCYRIFTNFNNFPISA